MSGRSAARRARAGRDDTDLAPDDVTALRTVALVGPSSGGKTTLVEHLLVASGAIPRAGTVADGTTVCDHDPAARHQHRSVALAAAATTHRDTKITFLDTPGCADFLGDVRAGLRAADAVLFVVGAADLAEGVPPAAAALWEECARAGLPAAVALTRLDHPRADDEAALASVRALTAATGTPAVVPWRVHRDHAGTVTGLACLLDGPADPGDDAARREMVEALIEAAEDEAALEQWILGDDVPPDALRADLRAAVAAGTVVPVVPVAAPAGVGLTALLDLLVTLPSPDAGTPVPVRAADGTPREATADPDGPLVAEVVHTGADPHGGRVSLLRVFSGTLRPDAAVAVVPDPRRATDPTAAPTTPDGAGTVRVGRLHAPLGAVLREVPHCVAGDVCAVTRLAAAATGDTLTGVDDPLGLDGWELPEPLLPVAVAATERDAQDALARGLARVEPLEPVLRVDRREETHQVVLWCTGEAHADAVLDRLRGAGAAVDVTDLVIPLRETVAGPASARGRHVKQSGGHGQFAVCVLELEPLPRGSGVEFVDRIVGGAIPRAYIPGVERGVREQLAAGVHPGRPVVDVRVTLVDGKAHSVDSSEQAFRTAGALAVREAVEAAGTVLLEPLDDVVVDVDDDQLGTVLGDLASRHGRVVGTEPGAGHHTRVHAEVPEASLVRYLVDLSALTGGTGRFTRRFARYAEAATRAPG